MARPLILDTATRGNLAERTNHGPRASSSLPLSTRLRQRRSAVYVAKLKTLDAGSAKIDAKELIEVIRAELGELSVPDLPLGILSRCHLGAPYEVHTLDLTGEIVSHFKHSEAMAAPFERGRALALHRAYAFIEVYPASLHLVREDGTVTLA